MSAQIVCDGCGTKLEAPIVIGRVVPREYCADCGAKAEGFLEAEEALRKGLHEKFIDDRALLIANLSADGFKLPDVADA